MKNISIITESKYSKNNNTINEKQVKNKNRHNSSIRLNIYFSKGLNYYLFNVKQLEFNSML